VTSLELCCGVVAFIYSFHSFVRSFVNCCCRCASAFESLSHFLSLPVLHVTDLRDDFVRFTSSEVNWLVASVMSASPTMAEMIKLKNGGSGGGSVKCCCSPMCCGGGVGGGVGAIVRVVCNNADCSYPQWMHSKCFDVWEQTVVQYVARTAAASSSSGRGGGGAAAAADRQRYHQQQQQQQLNLWTKKGYELAYKVHSPSHAQLQIKLKLIVSLF